jgi:hypothetical protein
MGVAGEEEGAYDEEAGGGGTAGLPPQGGIRAYQPQYSGRVTDPTRAHVPMAVDTLAAKSLAVQRSVGGGASGAGGIPASLR